MRTVKIGGRTIGEGKPCFIIAEIGQNHNGDIEIAKRMIEVAHMCGADMVKFQKRDVDLAVPESMRAVMRETPWGTLDYLSYRKRLEFGRAAYDDIDRLCRRLNLPWTASAWDAPSVEFLMRYELPCLKAPSGVLTDLDLLRGMQKTGVPLLVSTGMATEADVDRAVEVLGRDNLVLLHCVSTYPAPVEELNLACIPAMQRRYAVPIGWSGHEVGVSTTVCAVALGATVVERHFTLDRSSWGTDHAASLEPEGFQRMARDVRKFERARGDGVKRVLDSERPVMARLRRVR